MKSDDDFVGVDGHRFYEPGMWVHQLMEEMDHADRAIIAVANRDQPTADTPEIRQAMVTELMDRYRSAFEAAIRAKDEARLNDVAVWIERRQAVKISQPYLLNPNRSASGLDVLPGAERPDAPRLWRVISEGSTTEHNDCTFTLPQSPAIDDHKLEGSLAIRKRGGGIYAVSLGFCAYRFNSVPSFSLRPRLETDEPSATSL